MAPNSKAAKACKTMGGMGYSGKVVKPVLKNLLKLYDNNWKFIEEENYRVLIDAIIESEDNKVARVTVEKKNALSEGEPDESEPPLKRSKSNNQTDQSAPSCHNSPQNDIITIGNMKNKVENQARGKKNMAESSYKLRQDEDMKPTVICQKYHQDKGKNHSSPISHTGLEQTKETHLLSNDEYVSSLISSEKRIITYETGDHSKSYQDLCNAVIESVPFPDSLPNYKVPFVVVPPDPPRLLLEGGSCGTCSDANANCSTFPELIDLDAEEISDSMGKSSDLEGHHFECMDSEQFKAEEEENSVLNASKIDIASSSRREVKISLTYKSSLQSHFQAPSLESVLKQVEEKCLKSYKITLPGFSMLKLMKDMCECFLAACTASNGIEQGVPRTVSKECNPQAISVEGVDHQLTFCINSDILNGLVNYRNRTLIEVASQTPHGLGPIHMDLIRRHMRNYNIDGYGCSDKDKKISRKIIELDSLASSSAGVIIVQKQHSSNYVQDITKGQEAYRIPLINEINEEPLPTFYYIQHNVVYQNAYVKFLLARMSDDNCCSNCFGDCLSSEIPCACAGETGGEFAYMPGGLVKEKYLESCISMNHDPQQHNLFYCKDCPLERTKDKRLSGKCKGHLVRKFIKECWYKCGCSMLCGNRVVQRGITARLQVFMTPGGKGWGLRTLEDMPKGAFICEYVGEVVTNTELFERNVRNTGEKHTYPVLLDADWSSEGVLKDEEALCLDATSYGNVARFINHRCSDANLVEIPVEVETPDHHYYHVAFFTTRKVDALEELTWDYGIDFDDHSHPVKAFKCQCGSEFCRDRKSKKRRKLRL
ncbi:unnamed protein product [Fraxinus pennsylvanica]|uniref:SET domain-containing protein n=1 Tax=Fraxinus pennsylvanica TaxID=56036 RepID=A0AAD1ZK05_9LAMI|nr:unnamed protein product [Fraxinus pennsylvanica]